MTVQTFFDRQLTSEIKKYTADFDAFIPAGGSVSSASGAYAQTFGGSASGSCAAAVAGGSLVTLTTPALSAAGQYTFTASATLSDGQLRKALWYITVNA